MAGKLEEVLARLDLCHKLSLVINETEDEFQKLPIFVRPMAIGGFKKQVRQKPRRLEAQPGFSGREASTFVRVKCF
jgi:hypothetical protein